MLLWGRQAEAQYKHVGMGGSLGLQNTFNQSGNPAAAEGTREKYGYGVGFSYISLGFEGSFRFENKWAASFETLLSFHSCGGPSPEGSPVGICTSGKTPIMLAVSASIRYYFITDEFRPFADLGIGYWRSVAYTQNAVNAFGPHLTFGFEWFFKEEISLGFQLRYGLQLMAEKSGLYPFHQLMGGVVFRTYL